MKQNTFFTIIYLLIALANIAAGFLDNDLLRYIFKPLIMISLLTWSVFWPDRRFVQRKVVFQIGMALACAGDIFLMLDGFFLQGLGAFLIMQLLYVATFWKEIRFPFAAGPLLFRVFGMTAVLVLILIVVLPHMTDPVLKAAVTVYAFVITLMALFASLRNSQVSNTSFIWVLSGAGLFMVSDTLIAFNAFVTKLADSHFWVMSTYMIAQFAIVRGMLKTR